MGTSSSGSGAGNKNPLIPSWIGGGGPPGSPPPPPPPPLPPLPPLPPGVSPALPGTTSPSQQGAAVGGNGQAITNFHNNQAGAGATGSTGGGAQSGNNRFNQPRRDFNAYVRSGGRNSSAGKNALRGYSRKAAGNTQNLALRMRPSAARVSLFYQTINSIRDNGKAAVLAQFNLSSYDNKPLFEILSALTDIVFADTGQVFEDTQDDSLTKAAYSNTIIRICEMDNIDLNSLTNDQVQVMTAVFIEETIVHRVITDIGNKLTEKNTSITELIEIENSIYQIVSGLVRTSIVPEIAASQLGDKTTFNSNVENIYRIAFDTIASIN